MLISPSLRTILKTDEKTKSCSLETYITLAHKDDYRMVDRLFEKALSHGKPFQVYSVLIRIKISCKKKNAFANRIPNPLFREGRGRIKDFHMHTWSQAYVHT
ncbi:hypothetical protein AAMO2058_000778000 [Amorphochlora amoebiformis]